MMVYIRIYYICNCRYSHQWLIVDTQLAGYTSKFEKITMYIIAFQNLLLYIIFIKKKPTKVTKLPKSHPMQNPQTYYNLMYNFIINDSNYTNLMLGI